MLLLAVPAAGAADFAGGSASVKLSPAFKQQLKSAKVTVKMSKLPVEDGKATLAKSSAGSLELGGTIKFSRAGKSVTFTKLVQKLAGARGALSGKVKGKNKTLFSELSGKLTGPTADFATLKGSKLPALLNAKAAAALNKGLKTTVFTKNMKAGSVSFSAERELTFQPNSGTTKFVVDPRTAGGFQTCAINLAPIAPAAGAPPTPTEPAGSFSFPVNGGQFSATENAGTVSFLGGISISKTGSPTVDLTAFSFEYAGSSPLFTAAASPLNGGRAPIADLVGGTFTRKLTATGGTVSFSGISANWNQAATSLLQAFFACSSIPAGTPIGVVSGSGTVK